jgi:hypothetical protein
MTEEKRSASSLVVEIKRGANGPSLTCVRADGSRTWRRVQAFFPIHDLVHFALETTLGLRQAFFGLVASGWDIADFEAKGAAAKLPAEAVWAEFVVGLLQTEDADGARRSAEEFAATLASTAAPRVRTLTADELTRVRAAIADLAARWRAVPPGETLRLEF